MSGTERESEKTSGAWNGSRVFLRKIYNCTIPPPFPPSLPFLPSSSLPSFLLPPFSRGPGVSSPEIFLELEMLVGEFESILDIKINTIMNQVFKWCFLFRNLCLILAVFSGCCVWIPHYNGAWLAVYDTVAVLLGVSIWKGSCFVYRAQKNCIFTTAQISVYNCTKFLQLHNLCTTAH